jgi:hypothetical protein
MFPITVATLQPLLRRTYYSGIASEPVMDRVVVKLLAPKKTGISLAFYTTLF